VVHRAEVEDALVGYAKERTRHKALADSAQDFKRSEMLARERYGGIAERCGNREKAM